MISCVRICLPWPARKVNYLDLRIDTLTKKQYFHNTFLNHTWMNHALQASKCPLSSTVLYLQLQSSLRTPSSLCVERVVYVYLLWQQIVYDLSYIASFSFDCHHTQIVNQINCQYYSLIKSTFIWPIRSLALSFRSCTEHLYGFGWLLIMSLFFIEEYASIRPCEAWIHPNLGYYLLSIFALDLLDVK